MNCPNKLKEWASTKCLATSLLNLKAFHLLLFTGITQSFYESGYIKHDIFINCIPIGIKNITVKSFYLDLQYNTLIVNNMLL